MTAAKGKIALLLNMLLPGSQCQSIHSAQHGHSIPHWGLRGHLGVPWKAGGSSSRGGHLQPLLENLESWTQLEGLEGKRGTGCIRVGDRGQEGEGRAMGHGSK